MNVLKRHKNTFWYPLTTVYKKKRKYIQKTSKEITQKKKQKEKSLKSELRGKMKRQSFRRKEISKEIMCDGL